MAVDQTRKSARQWRQELKRRIDHLSVERLPVADDFLAYLEERESEEATAELLRIPGLLKDLEEAEREFAEGKGTPVEKLRRKYRRNV
jgi:hypothetical protein